MMPAHRSLPSHDDTRAMLASLRPARLTTRRAPAAVDDWEEGLQRAVEDTNAAVLPGSLMAFNEHISRQDKQDILLCHQLVQILIQGARARQATDDWFAYYKRRLEFLGWYELYLPDSGPSSGYLPPDVIDEQTLQAIRSIGQPGAGLQAPAVERLEASADGQRLMARGAVVSDSAVYRFLPSITTANGKVEALLYQRHVRDTRTVSRNFLFPRITAIQQVEEKMAVIAFRPTYFERHRQQVMDTLRQQIETGIYPL